MKHIKPISLLMLIAAFLSACQTAPMEIQGASVSVIGGEYVNVSPVELNVMLKNKDFVFINVHIPLEGNIVDTDLSIPYDQIGVPENLEQLPSNKSAKIILYCRSGRMSAIAAETLISLGYINIWNLDGGMVAWERAGYEIEK